MKARCHDVEAQSFCYPQEIPIQAKLLHPGNSACRALLRALPSGLTSRIAQQPVRWENFTCCRAVSGSLRLQGRGRDIMRCRSDRHAGFSGTRFSLGCDRKASAMLFSALGADCILHQLTHRTAVNWKALVLYRGEANAASFSATGS
jgi:hypothetical protein